MEQRPGRLRPLHVWDTKQSGVDYGSISSCLLTPMAPSKLPGWKHEHALQWTPLHDYRTKVQLRRITRRPLRFVYYKRLWQSSAASGAERTMCGVDGKTWETLASVDRQRFVDVSLEYFQREHSDLYIPDEILHDLVQEATDMENLSRKQRLLDGNLLAVHNVAGTRYIVYADTTGDLSEIRIAKMIRDLQTDGDVRRPPRSRRKTTRSLTMSLPIRHIASSGNDGSENNGSYGYVGAYSCYETVMFRPMVGELDGQHLEQIDRVRWERQPSSFTFSPFYPREALIGFEDGTGRIWDGSGDVRTNRALWSTADEPCAIKCDYLDHPRVMVSMYPHTVSVQDVRMHRRTHPCQSVELPAQPTPNQNRNSRDPLYAMCVSPGDRTKFWLGSQDAILLYDCRLLRRPLLSWNHHMEDNPPCGLQTLQLAGSKGLTISWNREGGTFAWFWSADSANCAPSAIGAPSEVMLANAEELDRPIGFSCWFESRDQQLVCARLSGTASIAFDSYDVRYAKGAVDECPASSISTTNVDVISCLKDCKLENHVLIDSVSRLPLAGCGLTRRPDDKEMKRHQTIQLRPLIDRLKMKFHEHDGHTMDVLDWDDVSNWLRNSLATGDWSERMHVSTLDVLLDYNRQTERPLFINELHLTKLTTRILTDETLRDLLEPCYEEVCDVGFQRPARAMTHPSETSSNWPSKKASIGVFRVKSLSRDRAPLSPSSHLSARVRQFDVLWRAAHLRKPTRELGPRESRLLSPSFDQESRGVPSTPLQQNRRTSVLEGTPLSDYRPLSHLVDEGAVSRRNETPIVPNIRTASTPLPTTASPSQIASSATPLHVLAPATIAKKTPRRSGF